MKKYINYIDLNEDYNPAQTFKAYALSNFNEDEIFEQYSKIVKPFIERLIKKPNGERHELTKDMSNLSGIDFIEAIKLYVKDYDENDPFIKFLYTILESNSKYVNILPEKMDDLTPEGEEFYRLLQLIGEDVFYELLVQELDKIDVAELVQSENNLIGQNPLNGNSIRSAQNFIYKNCVPVTEGLWDDDIWEGIKRFWKKLSEYNIEVNILGSQYYNFPYNEKIHTSLPYKEWKFEIPFIDNNNKEVKLYGSIRGNGAGSVDDPLDEYDVTVVFG